MKAAQNIDDEIDGLNILCPDSAGSAESSKFQGNSQQKYANQRAQFNSTRVRDSEVRLSYLDSDLPAQGNYASAS